MYHSGELIVNELEIPAWGSPARDVIKIGPDSLAVSWGPHHSRPMALEPGYRYTLGFSGDIVTCSPFRVSLVHPR